MTCTDGALLSTVVFSHIHGFAASVSQNIRSLWWHKTDTGFNGGIEMEHCTGEAKLNGKNP